MIPIPQRIVDEGRGDCLTCCIASILELPYERVPTWMADAYDAGKPLTWYDRFTSWLRAEGFHYLTIPIDTFYDWRMLEGAWCVASMPSQRFPGGRHAVVGTWEARADGGHHFVIAYDPQPMNRPYEFKEVVTVSFLVPLSPRVPHRRPTAEWGDLMDREYGPVVRTQPGEFDPADLP